VADCVDARVSTLGMLGLFAAAGSLMEVRVVLALQGDPMRAVVVILLLGLTVAGCDPEQDITGAAPACPMRNYSSYNPKEMNQCVAACKACDRGNTVTCTTSCTLKGAR
jgi:hypothetical protein